MTPDPATTAAIAADRVLELVLHIPASKEAVAQHPRQQAHKVSRAAARRASVTAGSLSLPPGVLGWITLIPELLAVWKVQAQMVSDIAAVYGRSHQLGREQMLYCLFRHVAAQLFRDVVVRVGERVVVQQATLKLLQSLAQQLGIRVTQAMLSKGAARFVPLIGAAGVAAYAYYDTLQVAKTAVELFEREQTIEVLG